MTLTKDQRKAAKHTVSGLSSTDVAKLVGVDRRTINRWKKIKEFQHTLKDMRKTRDIASLDIRESIHYEACRVIHLWLTGNKDLLLEDKRTRVKLGDLKLAMKLADQFSPSRPKMAERRDPRDERILGGKVKESDLEPMPIEEVNKINNKNGKLSQKEQILKKSDKAWQWLVETSMRLLLATNSIAATCLALKEHYDIGDALASMVSDEASKRLGSMTKENLNTLFGTRTDVATMEQYNLNLAMNKAIKAKPEAVLTALAKLKAESDTGGQVVDPALLLMEQIPHRSEYEQKFYLIAGMWPEEHDNPSIVKVPMEDNN